MRDVSEERSIVEAGLAEAVALERQRLSANDQEEAARLRAQISEIIQGLVDQFQENRQFDNMLRSAVDRLAPEVRPLVVDLGFLGVVSPKFQRDVMAALPLEDTGTS